MQAIGLVSLTPSNDMSLALEKNKLLLSFRADIRTDESDSKVTEPAPKLLARIIASDIARASPTGRKITEFVRTINQMPFKISNHHCYRLQNSDLSSMRAN